MALEPTFEFGTLCPACRAVFADDGRASFRYCEMSCLPSPHGYIDGATMSSPPSRGHLHIVCNRCDFQFVAEVAEPERAKAMRRSQP